MNCPICDVKLDGMGNVSEDGMLWCPRRHYTYRHSYGIHTETFDVDGSEHTTQTITWGYNESRELTDLRQRAAVAFVAYAKGLRKGK